MSIIRPPEKEVRETTPAYGTEIVADEPHYIKSLETEFREAPPPPPLSETEMTWLDGLLRRKGLRETAD